MKIAPPMNATSTIALRDGSLGVVGLLGQRADGVKAEERVRRNGRAGRDGREATAPDERRHRHQRLRAADQMGDRQDHEEQQDQQLHGHQHEVGAVGDLQPDDVERGREDDVRDDPHPERHARELALQIRTPDQPDDERQKEVVEQDRPPHNETQSRVERFADVGVGRAGHREVLGHQPVAQRGEQHRHGGQQIGARTGAVRLHGDHAEDAEHDDRRHIGQAEQQHRAQVQLLLQRGVVNVVCAVFLSGHEAPLGCHRLGSFRPW